VRADSPTPTAEDRSIHHGCPLLHLVSLLRWGEDDDCVPHTLLLQCGSQGIRIRLFGHMHLDRPAIVFSDLSLILNLGHIVFKGCFKPIFGLTIRLQLVGQVRALGFDQLQRAIGVSADSVEVLVVNSVLVTKRHARNLLLLVVGGLLRCLLFGHIHPPITIINEIGDLPSVTAMAVAEGYKLETDSQTDVAAAFSMRERLRASLLRQHSRYTTYTLPAGDEILPLYDARMRFYFVESGKLRLYNLLPNEPTITLSILSENDVFLQWRRIATFRACAPWR
jgi:hypothetical protein